MTVITFYGSSTDVQLKNVFLECLLLYANPLIIWKRAKIKRVVIQGDDGEKRKLTGDITLEQIQTTIQKMKTPLLEETKGGSDSSLRKRIVQGMLP